jgi:hypothetical protein
MMIRAIETFTREPVNIVRVRTDAGEGSGHIAPVHDH